MHMNLDNQHCGVSLCRLQCMIGSRTVKQNGGDQSLNFSHRRSQLLLLSLAAVAKSVAAGPQKVKKNGKGCFFTTAT